jgi:ketosteroid isomerase-like protein
MGDWIRDYYADVDAMALEPWLARHTDDVVVRFGNNPPAEGKAAVGEAIAGFWSTIGGLSHAIKAEHHAGDTVALEVDVTYERKDGASVMVPCASVLHRRGELVDSLNIYIDLAPVYS